MNKQELIESVEESLISQGHPIESHAQASRIVNAVFDIIQCSVSNDDNVNITGFGVFYKSYCKSRVGRDINTGKPIHIQSKNVPRFKAGKHFKDSVK